MNRILSNEESMMPGLMDFFSRDYNFHIFEEWIESNKSRSNKQSLRLLEWFNTNYSKKFGVEYKLKKGNTYKVILVWQKYNSTLSSGYGKKLFDPFGRGKDNGKLICLEHNDKIVYTTLAQLNYFQWAIKNGVIDYVKEHLDEIYADMIERMPARKTEKTKKTKISVSASQTLRKHDIKMTISFNPITETSTS